MSYSFLVARINTTNEPSDNLLFPVKTVTRYTTDAMYHTFDDEVTALAAARAELEKGDLFVLTGTIAGLDLYEQLWMGIGEECLHDITSMAEKIQSGAVYWEYGDSDANRLKQSIEEYESGESAEHIIDGSRSTVVSFAMTKSSLVHEKFSSTFYLFHESQDAIDTLTDEELASITTPDTLGKTHISISMGALFDRWCINKFNGNIEKAMVYANALAIKSTLSMKWYSIKSTVDERKRELIIKINKTRIDKGWL